MRGKRNRLIVIVLLSLLVVTAIAMIAIQGIGTNAAATNGENKIEIPVSNTNYEVGTEQNPFVLLEIVPYEGYAEIGYLIAGEEPVNMEVLSWSSYAGNIAATNAFDTSASQYITTFEPSEAMLKAKEYKTEKVTQYGYFEKVYDKSGNYNQVIINQSGGTILDATYELSVPANTGNYRWIGLDYNPGKVTDHNADKVYTSLVRTQYAGNKVDYTSKHIFLKQCLGLSDYEIKDYHIKVITATASQVNNNLALIDRANLIYITDKSHNGEPFLWFWQDERFKRTDKFKYNETLGKIEVRFTSAGRDLSWEAVVKILRKKSGCGLDKDTTIAPLIYDVNSLTSSMKLQNITIKKTTSDGKTVTINTQGSDNNVYKLGLMIRQMDTADIFKYYIDTGWIQTKTTDGKTTGSFVSMNGTLAATYWAPETLVPYHLVKYHENSNVMRQDLIAAGYPRYNDFSNNTFAEDSMYMFNADNSLSMTFEPKSIAYTEQTKDAFAYFGITKEQGIQLSPAEVIKYLLNYARLGSDLPSLTILEIQPFDQYKIDWNDFIRRIYPGFHGTLTVKTMTSKEFNCHIEDLNGTYDLIYLGVKKGTITENQELDLSDSSYTYSHVGTQVKVKNDNRFMAEWIPGNGSGNINFNTRYSGNDITALKMEQLKEYVKAGYPLMLGEGVFASDPSTISSTIDPSSYVYELLTFLKSNYAERQVYEKKINQTEEEKARLRTFIRNSFCNVTFEQLPRTYEYGKDNSYINAEDDKNRNLDLIFQIDDKAIDKKYKISIYLDVNADGIFCKEQGLKNEMMVIENVIDLTTGKSVKTNSLVPGKRYRLIKEITYSGVIPWKIVIEQVDNSSQFTGVRVVQTGISAIKKTDGKIKLNVLQIASNKVGDNKPSVYLPTSEEIRSSGVSSKDDKNTVKTKFKGIVKDESGAKLSTNLTDVTALFYYYTRNLKDYEITFDRLTVSEYVTKFNAKQIKLEDYNMIIIGFADCCTDITNEAARNAIYDFIMSGKSVLFTHDTTMYMYGTKHYMTSKFRDLLGMDRFGTKLVNQKTIEDLLELGKDIMYQPGRLQSEKKSEPKMSYGFSNHTLRRFASDRSVVNFDNLKTTKVTNVNQGQITQYPYLINNQLIVAQTHAQYYQLDMNNPNIVVWYSLEDDRSNQQYFEKNDGQNGYYIYSNGNITYSGAGHIGEYNQFNMQDEEIKLFVNTIIAAYRVVPEASDVEIMNGDKTTDENEKNYLLINYDMSNDQLAVGYDINTERQTKRIYYQLKDNSTVNSSLSRLVEYFAVDELGNLSPISLVTKLSFDDSEVENTDILLTTQYYIDVPLTPLGTLSCYDIAIRVTETYMGAEKEIELTKLKYVQLLRRGLFSLD